MATSVKLNYADLNAVVGKFRNEANDIEQARNTTNGKVQALHNNQWIGDAADKFFGEMEDHVLPAVARLVTALGTAADAVQKVAGTIQSFDQETQNYFKA